MRNTYSWGEVLIPELLFFQEGPGVRNTQFRDHGVKLLNVGNINNGTINLSSTKTHLAEEEANGKYSHFLIDEGDLLIACSGIVVDNFHNKIAFASKDHLPLCLNTSTMRFKSLNSEVLEIFFFKYFLQSQLFKNQIGRLITGSAQLNFGPSHIKKIKIPLPPLDQQKKIAAILDAADTYRQKSKALIAKYDELTQSLFLDMFGDPVSNTKGWEIKSFEEIVQFDMNMTTDFEKYGDLLHIGIGNIEKNTGKIIDCLTANEEGLTSGKYLFDSRHIIYSKIRPNLNKVALPEFNGLCSADSYPLLPKKGVSNRVFIAHLLRSECFVDFILQHSTRTNIPKANKSQMKLFIGICPPFELQNQFSERVQAIETQKALAQESLAKAEDLFNSLLQRAFKGELI